MDRLGHYDLLDVIGRGGMGTVYRALDMRYNRTVALKVMSDENRSEEFERWFRREADLITKLNSEHIVPIHGYGEIGGTPYLDMRWVKGDSLSGVLRKFGPANLDTALDLLKQAADALDDAHSVGVVHRDVKPGNILINSRGFAYLADFGIACPIHHTGEEDDGRVLGSWSYMSPERFVGDPIEASSDTYALACVLHFALTGHPPFGNGTIEEMRERHLHAEPPRLAGLVPEVTPELDHAIAWALAKDPRDRPGSTGEWVRELYAVRNQVYSVPPTPTVPVYEQQYDDPGSDSSRTRLLWALLVVLTVLACGLAALALGRV